MYVIVPIVEDRLAATHSKIVFKSNKDETFDLFNTIEYKGKSKRFTQHPIINI